MFCFLKMFRTQLFLKQSVEKFVVYCTFPDKEGTFSLTVKVEGKIFDQSGFLIFKTSNNTVLRLFPRPYFISSTCSPPHQSVNPYRFHFKQSCSLKLENYKLMILNKYHLLYLRFLVVPFNSLNPQNFYKCLIFTRKTIFSFFY